jgi:hypothetical protein
MTERASTLIQSALAMTIGILQFTAVVGGRRPIWASRAADTSAPADTFV